LNGKNVVITGGSAGIGEQLAYHYARMGARLLITARTEANLRKVKLFCIAPRCSKYQWWKQDENVKTKSPSQRPVLCHKTAILDPKTGNYNQSINQSNIYIAPIIEGRICGAGVWVTRRDRQKRKGGI